MADPMEDGEVRLEMSDTIAGVAVVTVDRPPVNAMTPQQYDRIGSTFESLHQMPDLKCVVFTGGGSKVFIGGADLRYFGERTMKYDGAGPHLTGIHRDPQRAPIPVICALNGSAMGAGPPAACCDIVIAGKGIKLGLPEPNVGVPVASPRRHAFPDRVAKSNT